MCDPGDLVLDGAPSGLPPAIRAALDDYVFLMLRPKMSSNEEAGAKWKALESAILSALPSQPAPSGEALEALERLERGMYEVVGGVLPNDQTDFAVVRAALAGLPQQPTEDVIEVALRVLGERKRQAVAAEEWDQAANYRGAEFELEKVRAQFGSPPSPTSKEG